MVELQMEVENPRENPEKEHIICLIGVIRHH